MTCIAALPSLTLQSTRKPDWVFIWLGPNSLIFSFSSGASPAHNAGGQVLQLCIYP